MDWLAIDTETEPILPGRLVPRLVCLSYADAQASGVIHHTEAVEIFRALATDPEIGFVFHNASYDLAVLVEHDEDLLPLVIDLLEQGRVVDTRIIEMLALIREGKLYSNPRPSLASLSAKYLNEELAKGEDTWRLRYGELLDIPVEDWPEAAVEYARKDAKMTRRVFFAQGGESHGCADLRLQVCASVALHAMSAWGLRTDAQAVAELEVSLLEATLSKREDLLASGILKWKHKTKKVATSRDMKVIKAKVEAALGAKTPRTPTGGIKTDDDTLAKVNDPAIQDLREYQGNQKELTDFVPKLWTGVSHPINPRFNVLVSTGRTSCEKPNVQQLPRRSGVRECFVPRPGHLFAAADWSAIEMVALAQVLLNLFGHSHLADALNADMDPHLRVAAQLAGVSYEEALARRSAGDADIKNKRQLSKIANFGYAGGMGASTFVEYARGYGVDLSQEMGEELKRAWFAAWPEMRRYFEYISKITGDMGPKKIEQQYSGRVRGDVGFCDGANTLFQGLVADAAKHTLWELFKACYSMPSTHSTDPNGALDGVRPVAFIHDEIIVEVEDNGLAPDRAEALANLMVETARAWMPDVKVKAEPVLMRRWFKNAETVRDTQGRLQIWEPES